MKTSQLSALSGSNRSFVVAFCAAMTVIGIPGIAFAQLASRQETLQGHQQVFLSVNSPESDDASRRFGIRKETLEQFLLARLEKAGIKASNQFTSQTLILEIHVDLHKVLQSEAEEVYAFISEFDAIQAARLATNRQAALATTWKSIRFGAVSRSQVQLLRDSVVQNLDEFIHDWQAANPAE